jgi:hypothetical protein
MLDRDRNRTRVLAGDWQLSTSWQVIDNLG